MLINNEIILKSRKKFKNEAHNVYNEIINKIALNSNDDKRLQTFDRIIPSAGKVCKTELLKHLNMK